MTVKPVGQATQVACGWIVCIGLIICHLTLSVRLPQISLHSMPRGLKPYLFLGDLAFGSSFGMVAAGKDSAPMVKDQNAGLASFKETGKMLEMVEVPAISTINTRTFFNPVFGVLSPFWQAIIKRILTSTAAGTVRNYFPKIVIAAVAKRLAAPVDRPDILSKLQEGKDAYGNPMGVQELASEAMTMFVAGSDTIAK